MKPQEVIAPLKRIAAEAIEVKPRTSCNQNLLATPTTVVESLDQITPRPVLMDLIEDPQPGDGELAFEYALSVLDPSQLR